MPNATQLCGACLLTIAASLAPEPAEAQISRDAAMRLCVDIAVVERNQELRGILVERLPDGGVKLAVRREWLREASPAEYNDYRSRERMLLEAGDRQLVRRLEEWIAELNPEEDRFLLAVLEPQLSSAQQRLEGEHRDDIDPAQFVLLTVPVARLRHLYIQTERRRQAGLCAFAIELEEVESTSLLVLEERLDQEFPEWRTTTIDLSGRLVSSGEQSDREWAARQALYEYQYLRPLAFQGMGDAVVPVDPQGQGDLSGLLRELLTGGVTIEFGSLFDLPELGRPAMQRSWRERVLEVASEQGVRGCRVTRVEHDLTRRQSTVEDLFLARMPDGTWDTVWSTRVSAAPGDVPAPLREQIREDERVQQVFRVARALGIGQAEIEQAVSVGAATLHAQSQANGRFREMLDRYLQRLDAPPLVWERPH